MLTMSKQQLEFFTMQAQLLKLARTKWYIPFGFLPGSQASQFRDLILSKAIRLWRTEYYTTISKRMFVGGKLTKKATAHFLAWTGPHQPLQ